MLTFEQGFVSQVRAPFWSPDGKYLAAQACGGRCLAVRDAVSGTSREIPIFYTLDPRWSPDGRTFIAAARDRRGRNGIFRIDTASGQPTLVVLGPGFNAQPQWLPDGATIVYRDGPRIMTVGLDGNASREIASVPRLRTIEVSPDGRTIAYIVDPAQGTAGRARRFGSSRRQEARHASSCLLQKEDTGAKSFSGLTWARDGGSVLVAAEQRCAVVPVADPRRRTSTAPPRDGYERVAGGRLRHTVHALAGRLDAGVPVCGGERGRGLGARRRPVRDPRAAMMSWRSRAPTP